MMSAKTFTRGRSSSLPLQFLSVNPINCYCCILILMILNYSISVLLLTSAQSVPVSRNEQYSSTVITDSVPPTTGTPIVTTNKSIQRTSQQPKSLKFTLIAGKFWRFDIKTNSFATYKEGELRLHKNSSANNYTTDDDGWFQYNHQQQQLFAWPSLATKPGTYYYALLPSKLDIEEENENMINVEVVASITVELIRPVYPVNKSDIDNLIDHKFSLNDLSRQSSYPLLLQQIVAAFEFIAAKSQNSPPNTTLSSILSPQKNKLNEYLLINSNYSQDHELLSLTWSTHPTLYNNTISQIIKCRLTSIKDTIARLSSPSNGQREDDKSVVYSIPSPILSSQAIVPNLRGNTVLKLTLNSPCQNETILEELGLTGSIKLIDGSILGVEDKENNSISNQTTPKVIVATLPPGLPNPEAIDSNTAAQSSTTIAPQISSTVTTEDAKIARPTITSSSPATIAIEIPQPAVSNIQILNTSIESITQNPLPQSTNVPPIVETQPSVEPIIEKTSLVAKVLKSEAPAVTQQQPKIQPQAKSLANFLDSSEQSQPIPVMSNVTLAPEVTAKIFDSTTSIQPVSMVSTTDPSLTSESTLNEDLVGILDDIMNYLISIAVPLSIVIGAILLLSILIAIWSLYVKRRQSKEFQVRNRFDFRYGSERRVFLKNSSKPVILDADQKSLSMGGTPQHRSAKTTTKNKKDDGKANYFHLRPFESNYVDTSINHHAATSFSQPCTDSVAGPALTCDVGANVGCGDTGFGGGGCDAGGGF